MQENIMKLLCYLACALFITSIFACRTTGGGIAVGWEPDSEISHPHECKKKGKNGPPPHAPAHGYRAKHTYHYYPDVQVYFDISKEVYFYMKGQSWQVSASLPRGLHVQLGGHVVIQLDSDKPYTRFKDHKKKYPPGQRKKNKDKWVKRK
jgi:hypothetical protein